MTDNATGESSRKRTGMYRMRLAWWLLWLIFVAVTPISISAQSQDTTSSATGACLTCHRTVTPGIVADWERSRHASVTPAQGLARGEL